MQMRYQLRHSPVYNAENLTEPPLVGEIEVSIRLRGACSDYSTTGAVRL